MNKTLTEESSYLPDITEHYILLHLVTEKRRRMTLTEESSYLPSITEPKDDRDVEQHWDINDNVLPIVSRQQLFTVVKKKK